MHGLLTLGESSGVVEGGVCSPPPVLKTVTHAGVWFHCSARPPVPHRTEFNSSHVSRDNKLNTLSSFIGPFKYFSPGLENTEDEDNLSKSDFPFLK
ncbi:hypothetical protein chiPu_0010332 [Chiloscyllium punctatum]|uniref:Uncharacterized protein n=1 Tax=Chiloscyllium punctatum TaxID=137246 RepID=A0A401SN99_CHIPU|nr:hypothetical protein [Chiloscyllium punctatum]